MIWLRKIAAKLEQKKEGTGTYQYGIYAVQLGRYRKEMVNEFIGTLQFVLSA
jgi:hypothetical protein